MAQQRRQPPAAKRTAGNKWTKRLAFESLERRNVLSAIGLPMQVPTGGIASPAHMGDVQPPRAYPMNYFPANMKDMRTADALSAPAVQSGGPMFHNSGGYGVDSDSAAFLPVTSINIGGASPVTIAGNVVVSQETTTSIAPSPVVVSSVGGSEMAVLEAPPNTLIDIDLSPQGVSVLFIPDALPIDTPPQHGANIEPQSSDVPKEGLGMDGYGVPQDGDRGAEQNVTGFGSLFSMVTGVGPIIGQVTLPTGAHDPAVVGFAGPSDGTAAGQPPRGDALPNVDLLSAAAVLTFDGTSVGDPAAGASGGNAAEGASITVMPIASQYGGTSNVNTADTSLSNSTDTGLVAIDFGQLSALRPVVAAPDSSGSAMGDLDGAGLSAVVSLAASRAPVQGNTGLRTSSANSPVIGEAAAAGNAAAPQTGLDADAGVIDLTGTAPITAVAQDGGDAGVVQDVNDVRPQSSVGVFCDMEVAVGVPSGDKAEPPSLSAPGAEARAAKLDQGAPPNERPVQGSAHRADPRQRASATLGDRVPLLASTVLIVLMDQSKITFIRDRSSTVRAGDLRGMA